jgi:hypothetical protein
MSADDHVRIASNTKTFVATAILQLVDRNQLSLDGHLDSFVEGVPFGDQIAIRQLLNMTAGVFDYTDDPQFVQDYIANPLLPFSLQDLLTVINRNAPRYPPGGPAQYDDSNYYLLGAIVEAVTGRTLGDFIQTEILNPLGLTETSYPTTSDMPTPFAHGYYRVSDAAPRDVSLSNPAVPAGAGAMISAGRHEALGEGSGDRKPAQSGNPEPATPDQRAEPEPVGHHELWPRDRRHQRLPWPHRGHSRLQHCLLLSPERASHDRGHCERGHPEQRAGCDDVPHPGRIPVSQAVPQRALSARRPPLPRSSASATRYRWLCSATSRLLVSGTKPPIFQDSCPTSGRRRPPRHHRATIDSIVTSTGIEGRLSWCVLFGVEAPARTPDEVTVVGAWRRVATRMTRGAFAYRDVMVGGRVRNGGPGRPMATWHVCRASLLVSRSSSIPGKHIRVPNSR